MSLGDRRVTQSLATQAGSFQTSVADGLLSAALAQPAARLTVFTCLALGRAASDAQHPRSDPGLSPTTCRKPLAGLAARGTGAAGGPGCTGQGSTVRRRTRWYQSILSIQDSLQGLQ